jgi:oxalate decarboxylase/phosphoglucose isomerase-like protein (cupin superfamily)
VLVAGAVAAVALAAPPLPTRTLLAQAPAHGAGGQELGLTSIVIPGGVVLAKHHHAGTQVATVIAGHLTYTVYVGSVPVYRAGVLTRTIRAGRTSVLAPGDTVTEQPTVVHSSANRGTAPVKLMLATLFPKNAPTSIPVK